MIEHERLKANHGKAVQENGQVHVTRIAALVLGVVSPHLSVGKHFLRNCVFVLCDLVKTG